MNRFTIQSRIFMLALAPLVLIGCGSDDDSQTTGTVSAP
jgi:hypothetical protein